MTVERLGALHRQLDACRLCPNVVGPVVHGPPVASKVFLVGQAPGRHEGRFGKPFAWKAGRTLFRWLEDALGADEEAVRSNIYFAAVARCFPGEARGGGDRPPDAGEIDNCRRFLEREVAILKPELVIPVGSLAIAQVLGRKPPLDEVVGRLLRARYHGVEMDVVCLPHPSGASSWHKVQPGKALLEKALKLLARHPTLAAVREAARFKRAGAPSPAPRRTTG